MSLKLLTDLLGWFSKPISGRGGASRVPGALYLAAALLLAAQAQAAPFNDRFADAGILTGDSGTTTGDNLGALSEPDEPFHAGITNGASVWWAWSPDSPGTFRFDTFGTDFDSVLAVYTGSALASLTPITSNDDIGPYLQSAVSFDAVTTQTYYVAVSGKGFSSPAMGSILLRWEPCGTSLDAPDRPRPADGETTSVPVSSLDWDDVPGALEYEVFVDGVPAGRTTDSSIVLGTPIDRGEHEWQVVARDVCSSSTGPLWRFTMCVPPEGPGNPYPEVDMNLPCGPVRLEWDDSEGAVSYDVYVDSILVGSTSSSLLIVPDGLSAGAHTWQVVVAGECDVTTGPVWSFCLTDTPSGPVPGDGETTACALGRLDWDDACGAAAYDVYLDSEWIATVSASDLTLTAPLSGGAHTWQVIGRGACGGVPGPVWGFCLLDTPANPTFPADEEPLTTSPTVLDWEDVCGATTYTVWLDGFALGQTTESMLVLREPLPDWGSHTWQVAADGSCSTVTVGQIWSFSVDCPPPGLPSNPTPADGETTRCGLMRLDWEEAPGADSYRVILDGVDYGLTSATELVVTVPLAPGPHDWQIIAVSACGTEAEGVGMAFCLLETPTTPVSPLDEEVLNDSPVALDWEDACGATTYVVLLNGDFLAETTESFVLLPEPLEAGTTHTWEVIVEGGCTWPLEGPIWQFSIRSCEPPRLPTNPLPADGETTGCSLAQLDWDEAPGADSYRVILDGVDYGLTSATELVLVAPLSPGYHDWQIIAVSACGAEAEGVGLSFCVLDVPAGPTTPADQDVVPGPVDTFDWADTCGATTYTLIVDGVVQGVTSTSLFTLPGGPLPDGRHTWQVLAQNDCSVTTGPEWTFYGGCSSVPPPSNPVPADGTTTDTSITRVSWDPVPDVTSYKVYINGNFVATVPDPFLSVTLGHGTYTWQVGANTRECGEVLGPVWTFNVCTRPGVPTLITPADGVTTSPDSLFFDWSDAENASAYLLIIDNTTFGSVFESHYQMPYPINSGPHVWRVVAQSGCDVTTSTEFSFCALRAPANPNPPDTSTYCVAPGALDWDDVESATGYDVYLNGQLVSANQTQSRYVLPQTLAQGQYTWRVVARNECGEMSGPEWTLNVVAEVSARRNLWTTNGSLYAMAVSGNIVYIGGSFSLVGAADGSQAVPRQNLAAVDITTGRAIDWISDTDAPVRALACDSGVLYVGGEFDRVAGQPRSQIAAVDMATGALLGWNPGANGAVQALAVDGSNVYAGGRFTVLGGANRRYAGAVSMAGGSVTDWNPSPNAFVRALCVIGSNVYIGGDFSSLGSQTRRGLAAVDKASGALLPWDPGVDQYVYAIATAGSRMYVGGRFNTAGGLPRRNLACLDMATGLADPWAPEANGAVNAIAVTENAVFVGGLFSHVSGMSRPYLAAVGMEDGEVPDCGYDPDYPVHCLAVCGDTVCVGGEFTYIGTSSLRGFAGFGGTDDPTRVGAWERY